MPTVAPVTTASLVSRTVPVTLADVTVCAESIAAPKKRQTQAAASHPASDRILDRIRHTPPMIRESLSARPLAGLKACATRGRAGQP
jgi:hypothetical protein